MFEDLSKHIELDANEPLSKAINALTQKDDCVVVTKDGKYAGIVGSRTIEEVTSDPTSTKLGSVMERAPVLDVSSPLVDVCVQFFTGHYKVLPVREDGKIIGLLNRRNVVAELASSGLLQGKVEDFMNSPVTVIPESATIAQAMSKMRESGVRRLVAMSGDKMKGILTVHDFKTRTMVPKQHAPQMHEKHSNEDAPISSLLVGMDEVVTTPPDAKLVDAAKKMVEKKVNALVVVSNSKPVGFISSRDMLESIIHQEKTPIYLSGLDSEERMDLDSITSEISHEVEKFAKSNQVDYLAMHFKRYGSAGHKYTVHARLKLSKGGIISAHNSGFELSGVVHGAMAELKTLMSKQKVNPMHESKPRGKRGEE